MNDKYNDIVKKLAINEVATAYRNNSSGKSNIHFAKEVIDFIKSQKMLLFMLLILLNSLMN